MAVRLAFAKFLRATRRGATPGRVAAAKRFLARELERYALFADEVATQQPTPEQRIAGFDDGFLAWHQDRRDSRAKNWRRCRAALSTFSGKDRDWLVDAWNRSGQPKHPENLLGHLATYLSDCRQRMASGERWFVFCVAGSIRILLWDPQHVPNTATAGPFDDYLTAVEESRCLTTP